MAKDAKIVGPVLPWWRKVKNKDLQRLPWQYSNQLNSPFELHFVHFQGIPNALRGEVWGRLLNINQLKQEQSGMI